ncbi:MAG TPA: PH domain-containing protein [Caulobacteraceae bacterium]
MSYLDKVLQPGEVVLVKARPHWIVLLGPLVLLALAAVLAIGTAVVLSGSPALGGYAVAGLVALIALFLLAGRMITRATTEFCVTDHRIIVKRGVLSLHTVELNVDKVESVDVDQSLLGRMFGYGEVTIHGVGARWDPIPLISDPLGFRNAITAHTAPVAATA